MDLVVRSSTIPRPGQTITGESVKSYPGGKGANQAVGAARLGARVKFVGCVGNDHFGKKLTQNLQREGVNTDFLRVLEQHDTGTAIISVDDASENAITVIPGANYQLRPEHIDGIRDQIAQADAVLLQLESPLQTMQHVCEVAGEVGTPVILDPAPAPAEPLEINYREIYLLAPNQSEVEALTRQDASTVQHARAAGKQLIEKGVQHLAIKLGHGGSVYMNRENVFHYTPAFPTKSVDATAAGDAFIAALTRALLCDIPSESAFRFANAAGALATTKHGAQPAMPTLEEIIQFLKQSL